MKTTTCRPHRLASLGSVRLWTSLLLCAWCANAQQHVRAAFEEQKVDWIVGSWAGVNEGGSAITVEYTWKLEGHALAIELTMDNITYAGMIVLDPTDRHLTELGADTRGGVTRATWQVEDRALVSRRTGTRVDGQQVQVAVVLEKVDANNVLASVHGLSADGTLSEEPVDTVRLKRKQAAGEDD